MQLPLFAVDEVIRTALQEDIHYLDTTTDLMIPADAALPPFPGQGGRGGLRLGRGPAGVCALRRRL